MPSEWAKQKATKIVDGVAFDEGCIEECIGDIATNLDAARAQGRREGRREGLEEAAQIALIEAAHLDGLYERMAQGADRVAIAIRARINQEPPTT